jgi:hypothetical protein
MRQTTSAVRKTAPTKKAARPKGKRTYTLDKADEHDGEPEHRESEPHVKRENYLAWVTDRESQSRWVKMDRRASIALTSPMQSRREHRDSAWPVW